VSDFIISGQDSHLRGFVQSILVFVRFPVYFYLRYRLSQSGIFYQIQEYPRKFAGGT
jgi:hypothetical protein